MSVGKLRVISVNGRINKEYMYLGVFMPFSYQINQANIKQVNFRGI